MLIDEGAGRTIATNLDLTAIGSARVLLVAKKGGMIEAIGPMLDVLANNGHDFSDALIPASLIDASLIRASEW